MPKKARRDDGKVENEQRPNRQRQRNRIKLGPLRLQCIPPRAAFLSVNAVRAKNLIAPTGLPHNPHKKAPRNSNTGPLPSSTSVHNSTLRLPSKPVVQGPIFLGCGRARGTNKRPGSTGTAADAAETAIAEHPFRQCLGTARASDQNINLLLANHSRAANVVVQRAFFQDRNRQ